MSGLFKKCINQYELVCVLLKEYEVDCDIDEQKTKDLTSQLKILIEYLHLYTQSLDIVDGKLPDDLSTDVLTRLNQLNDDIKKLKSDVLLAIQTYYG
jgi:hypothetical protein